MNYRRIKNVYNGIPGALVDEIMWVQRKYRTNRLSHIEGGSDVVVEYHEGDVFGYDWIKRPSEYIKSIWEITMKTMKDMIRMKI